MLIDDIHWAERTFLDLIRSVADTLTGVPVVLACSARPDLFDAHSDWGEESERHRVLVLQPLSEDESVEVAENLLGTTDLDAKVRTKIVEAAEGNPCSSSRCSRCSSTTGSWNATTAGDGS